MIKLSPSILSANFMELGNEIKILEKMQRDLELLFFH